ncbi:MAG: hypothetical protein ABSD68_01490 [Candidatus Micrarchaeales archaeon]|jgi:hypothetical protein
MLEKDGSTRKHSNKSSRTFGEILAAVERKHEIELCRERTPEKDISGSMALIATPERVKMVRNLRREDRRKK